MRVSTSPHFDFFFLKVHRAVSFRPVSVSVELLMFPNCAWLSSLELTDAWQNEHGRSTAGIFCLFLSRITVIQQDEKHKFIRSLVHSL